jgi:predicted transcriptional regulator
MLCKRNGVNEMGSGTFCKLIFIKIDAKTLARYGIVELHKEQNALVPEVKAAKFEVEFGLDAA